MEKTIEKLSEYGLNFSGNVHMIKDYIKEIFTNTRDNNDLPINFTRDLDIEIVDPVLFKEKFGLPDKYDILLGKLIERTFVRCVKRGEMEFHNPDFDLVFEIMALNFVRYNLDMLLKTNKKFKMKSAFDKEKAELWLEKEIRELRDALLVDPVTLKAREQLYQEFVISLTEDKALFLKETMPSN